MTVGDQRPGRLAAGNERYQTAAAPIWVMPGRGAAGDGPGEERRSAAHSDRRKWVHIGTWLAAKPVIDICLARSPKPPMSRPTCPRWNGPNTCCGSGNRDRSGHRMFHDPDTVVQLHLFDAGNAEINRMMVRFRDRLLNPNPDAVDCGCHRHRRCGYPVRLVAVPRRHHSAEEGNLPRRARSVVGEHRSCADR